MKFFVPGSCPELDPEWIWAATRAALLDLGLPTTRRRNQALRIGPRSDEHLVEVGMKLPDDAGPVIVILEAPADDLFYVCTPFHGVLEGAPFILCLSGKRRVIDFDEEVVG